LRRRRSRCRRSRRLVKPSGAAGTVTKVRTEQRSPCRREEGGEPRQQDDQRYATDQLEVRRQQASESEMCTACRSEPPNAKADGAQHEDRDQRIEQRKRWRSHWDDCRRPRLASPTAVGEEWLEKCLALEGEGEGGGQVED